MPFDELYSTPTNLLGTALISALVSAAVSFVLRLREKRHSAEVDYEYEERKRLRELTGRFHGRLLDAANNLNYRIWNLYSNHEEGWLDIGGRYDKAGYYFASIAYRFMTFFALVRLIESESLLLDARIATRKDFAFLNFVSAFQWVMTDVALFDGLTYDKAHQVDHFFSDDFRHYSAMCSKDGACLSFEAFKEGPMRSKEFIPILQFLDGMSPSEPRFRWDRLVGLHLLLLVFINNFGYRRQHSSFRKFCEVATHAARRAPLDNLARWLPRHDLGFRTGSWRITFGIRWGAPKAVVSRD